MLCCFFYAEASIRTCRSMGRHIVALEEHKELFLVLFIPMVYLLVVASIPQFQDVKRSQDPVIMDMVPT
jgi:hypothetical protein